MGFVVGLTGNIACGKTLAASLFSSFGLEVINADQISRELTTQGTPSYKEIVAHYGKKILFQNKEINRRSLRDLIFTDAKERSWLESLLHPLIRNRLQERVTLSTTPYCVVEIPLLLSRQDYPYLNKILLITASKDLQIARVMQRDRCSKEQALAIISARWTFPLNQADDVIHNDADLELFEQKIRKLHEKYLQHLTD